MELHIASIVVTTSSHHLARLETELNQLANVEVHASNGQDRLVITVECESERLLADIFARIESMPGVIAASVAFHGIENMESV
ncbi:MAG: chaperone NapD [Gammaproteobacteria bacterium]|nr:chaperone NapD [Gammaproteobacteria bacterium]